MFWLLKVLIGRSATAIDRPFTYRCPLEFEPKKFERVLVSFGNSKKVVGIIVEEPTKSEMCIEEYEAEMGFKISPIISILDNEPLLNEDMAELAVKMRSYYHCPIVSLYQAMLPPSYKPKDSALNKPKEKVRLMVRRKSDDSSFLTYHEKKLFDKLADGPMFADSSTRRTAAYQSLLIKEIIEEYEERVDRIKEFTSLPMNEITLSEEQEKAKQAIDNSELQTILLEGVTGSGKTMVYLKLCEEILNKGGSAIVLVPEIALTNHVISLFQTFFPDKVSLMHSGLSNANKMDEFSRIKEGKTSIVIGTRSALFAPLNNLKLIIIDEEQSDSYKQASTPFYDARTVARMRSEITGAKVIFASATPLVEDRCRAERGLYGYVRLEHKFATSSVVKAKFIDMSDLSNISPQTSSMLSVPLLEAMKRTFERHEQSMLLINRRGFSPIVKCRKCHKIMKCENCDIPLTYHKKANRLNCHRCDASNFAFSSFKCPYDGNTEFDELGYGTERIEEILKKTFPDMRIARLDRDTSQEKKRAEILDGFSKGDFDVLIGTEMIAKGHDFPNVTLAAALFADQSLSIPSYMANETTFDLICQLVGRSGRHEKEGEAFIQTYNPLNKILILAARQDYDSFYQLELENRKRFKFPPYVFMTQVTTQGPDAFQVHQVAKSVRNYLVTNLKGKKADIFGPYEPFEYKINGRYFERVLVKFKNSADVDEIFERLPIIATPAQKDVVVSIERDPRGE